MCHMCEEIRWRNFHVYSPRSRKIKRNFCSCAAEKCIYRIVYHSCRNSASFQFFFPFNSHNLKFSMHTHSCHFSSPPLSIMSVALRCFFFLIHDLHFWCWCWYDGALSMEILLDRDWRLASLSCSKSFLRVRFGAIKVIIKWQFII